MDAIPSYHDQYTGIGGQYEVRDGVRVLIVTTADFKGNDYMTREWGYFWGGEEQPKREI
jgi:hypothetical protein